MAKRLLIFGLLLALAGCGGKTAQRQRGDPPYFGPTETMVQVVEQINANNVPLRSLWARTDIEAELVEPDKGKRTTVIANGLLVHRKPSELRMSGNKDPLGRVFDLGSDGERFWMISKVPDNERMWWGHYRNVGKPCAGEIPIRPDLLLEVLGVSDVGPEFLQSPAPTMRFNPDADAYMLVWIMPAPDGGPERWVAQKEIWYDRQTKLPSAVLLFDRHGRVVLRAYLSRHAPVAVEGLPRERWPRVATDYRLFFPDTGSKMWLSLTDMQTENRGAPNDRTFAFPDRPGVAEVIQIDEACAD